MVAFGQRTISQPAIPRPRQPVAGPRTLRLSRLDGPPDDTGRAGTVRQVREHLLILVAAGRGELTVDFVTYPGRPGSLFWVRPGQALQVARGPGLDASLVRFDTDTAPPEVGHLLDEAATPAYWQLTGEDEEAIVDAVSQLEADAERYAGDLATAGPLLRHQLAVLLLRISLLRGAGEPTPAGVYGRFRREVETGYAHSRQVEEYAAKLGCSVRTVTRACIAEAGVSAKQVIDRRVALEAKRLLAYTDLPVATIGRRLGFPEATNFGRFFAREVGQSPGRFRQVWHH